MDVFNISLLGEWKWRHLIEQNGLSKYGRFMRDYVASSIFFLFQKWLSSLEGSWETSCPWYNYCLNDQVLIIINKPRSTNQETPN